MTEYSLRLPSRKPAIELIARLQPESRIEFSEELLDTLWDAYEAGHLPVEIVVLLRDWTARAHFADSPVVQERLAEARERVVAARPNLIRPDWRPRDDDEDEEED